MNTDNTRAQMRKGILEYCILAVLSRNSCYAVDIINELKKAEVIVVEGTLYPLLTRQKNAGLLSYRWEESPQGPPRKYYELTELGKIYLKELDKVWDELVDSVNQIRDRK
ncbi:MAG: PadR family transcriptional regulator [Bacteroidales bacterium]|jgi:PadR family transcriptional regulator PadR|nr:PadR family transcriptional regulator [Bacteroidales bacterium]NLD62550.1 PadR family transcriptional regulator [Bacteroidales bacterium]HNT94210.1 PadR family transcriptional regulator [Bacteroidales bacterium]HOO67284.1 PadR family transcriptional regulator [Bacteroidales bacterium]HPE23230.1 PadR family transcriptional regulator [Bacteroidales bacterium]